MARFTVVLDACVLYPAPVRDLLLQLATTGLFKAHWSEQIHDEWMRNLLRNQPALDPQALQRTRQLMDSYAEDALITGHMDLVEQLELPDADDHHVLAAAIKVNADAIVTSNLKDFPEQALEPHQTEAISPDDFIIYQFDLSAGAVLNAVKTIRSRLKSPSLTVEEYLAKITQCG